MKLFPDDHETITGTARRLRAGETTCVDVLQSCLDRIDEKESVVRAWVLVDRDGAMKQAKQLDEELNAGHDRGLLHGIPIGIKDIIDVQGMPTECGSPRRSGRPAETDATIVSRLRNAGAVILGKTVTTAYAWIDPPVTRNPWNLDRTPGGSSSGSAAAVACGMCLGAIGTQTGGSITRPASFCGVCGMKPTFGSVSTNGILPFAPSLDHPGPIARCVGDLRLLYQILRDAQVATLKESQPKNAAGAGPSRLGWIGGSLERHSPGQVPSGPLSGHVRSRGNFFDDRAHPEMRWAMYDFLKWLQGCGTQVTRLDSPVDFEELISCHRTVMAAEAAATHNDRFTLLPEAYPPRIAELIREGQEIRTDDYQIARGLKEKRVQAMQSSLIGLSAIVTPAAIGPAPDPATTGDPAFNSPWSYLGFPTVSFPIGFSSDRLPLAVQLIGGPGSELELLAVAEWCESVTPGHLRARIARHG